MAHALSVYIPMDRRHALARGVALPERAVGAALFADISGFTPLTEALTRALGPQQGAEELPHYLNQVYDALIAEVDRYGGSVISFAGDAITCWFADSDPWREGSAPASWRATTCAMAIQRAMARFAAVAVPGQPPVTLAVKVAVASGPARRFLVGQPDIQLIDVLAGQTLARMAAAEQRAGRGEVVVDAQTRACLGERAQAREIEREDTEEEQFFVVEGLTSEAEPWPWLELAPGALSEDQVRPWVLPSVYERLCAGLGEFITELRPATALFLRFGGIDYDGDAEAGRKLDAYIRWVQQVAARYEGTLLQLTMGDKGNYLYVAFGAPVAHEDDARRAAHAALELGAGAEGPGPVQIGLSQGVMRTGAYGGATRRTYGVLGDEVNLAARLMQNAAPGEIIASRRVHKLASEMFDWQALPAIRVKGKADPIPVYRLGGERKAAPGAEAAVPIIGRAVERNALATCLRNLERGLGGVIVIEGEAGMGKSLLADDLRQQAQAARFETLVGAGDAVEKATPYYAWRSVFAQWLDVGAKQDPESQRRHILARIQDQPDRVRLAPLLSVVLACPWPDNEFTTPLAGQERAEATRQLLAGLLQDAARRSPRVVILQDAHWLDSLSWELAVHLARTSTAAGAPLLLALITRPLDDSAAGARHLQVIEALDNVTTLSLAPLSPDETAAVAAARLGLPEGGLPEPVVQLVQRLAEGNPMFAAELALTLRDQGVITVEPDPSAELARGEVRRCRLTGDLGQAVQNLPHTIGGLVLARIDRLPLESQLALKIASVIGQTFAYAPLRHAVQTHANIAEATLRLHLGALAALGLTRLHTLDPDLAYAFRQIVIQEVVYGVLLFAQRRQLHRTVAEWYEASFPDRLDELAATLAYHYSRADVAEKAIDYLLRAGDAARMVYANQEAIEYYQQALELLRKQGEPAYERTARTLMKLGLTYHTAFDFQRSRQAYEEGFALWQKAGEAPPAARPAAPHALRVDWPYMPLTLDPALAEDVDTRGVVDQLFSGLVDLGPGMDIVPDVARGWEILEDGRRYVFHLRDDVRWSDGTPVTAEDFVYAWRRVLDPRTNSPIAGLLYDVKGARAFHAGQTADPDSVGVRAPTPQTLEVELEQPTGYFLYLMAYNASYPVPRHAVEACGAAWAEVGRLVTNGPFRLDEYDPAGRLVFSRSPTYHGRFAGNAQRVEVYVNAQESVRLETYTQGKLDTLSFRNISQERERVRQRHAGEYVSIPLLAVTCLGFDTNRPPFDDPRVRQAFGAAVDRERWANVNLGGFAFPATGGFVPPGMPGHSADIALAFSPDQARRLLDEAGYPGGRGFPPVEFLGGPDNEAPLDYIATQWRDNLGVDVAWATVEWAGFFDRFEREPPNVFFFNWYADYPDPDNFLRGCAVVRWTRWQNETYWRVVEEACRTTDPRKRMEMYHQADKMLIESAVILPLSYWRTHLLVKPWIKLPSSAVKWWYWKDVVIEPHA